VAQQALQSGASTGNLSSHLAALSTALTQLVMDHVSQALFNSDRLAFGMYLAYNLVPHLFQAVEWDLFLGNAVGMMLSSCGSSGLLLVYIMSASCLHHVCIMSVSCLYHVCIMSASCLHHVCIMSASCLHHVCIMSASCLQVFVWHPWQAQHTLLKA